MENSNIQNKKKYSTKLVYKLIFWYLNVLIKSHFVRRLINQVAEEIWICEDQVITKWEGGIQAYKHSLKNKVMKSDKLMLVLVS